jgi:hypothetical protein
MSNSYKPLCDGRLERDGTIRVLLEEYRALYGLLRFRLEALDRRLPLAAGTIGVVVAGIPSMPPESGFVMLLILPPTVAWLVATMASHARAKEDHLRRIAEIELSVNEIAGRELLVFQSRHPGRGRFVSGRSGRTTLLAAASGTLAVLGGSGLLFHARHPPTLSLYAYFGYLILAAAAVVGSLLRLRRYRYVKPPSRVQLVLPGKN